MPYNIVNFYNIYENFKCREKKMRRREKREIDGQPKLGYVGKT